MGYSGRYHAASLAAVFIALAIGILIGIGLADDVVSTASQELEQSLRDERDQAEQEADDLRGQLDMEADFSDAAYPALVDGRLDRQRFAVVELGDVPDDAVDTTAEDAIDAAEQGGADLASVSSIALPVDLAPLAEAAGGSFKRAQRDPDEAERLGRLIGAQIPGGGDLIDETKPDLFSRFNGSLDDVTLLILIRNPVKAGGGNRAKVQEAFESGLIEGARRSAGGIVGVERTSTDPSTLEQFSDHGVSTVDDVDTPAGKVAMVYVLGGATGDFGVKGGASSLLPPLKRDRPKQ